MAPTTVSGITWTPTAALVRAVVVGSAALSAGLVFGRADVAVLAVPLLAGVALAARRAGGTAPGVRVALPRIVEQGRWTGVDLALSGAAHAELVTVRVPARDRMPHGATLALSPPPAGSSRTFRAPVLVCGRGRVMLARPDLLTLGQDGLFAHGPHPAPEALSLALAAFDAVPPGPLPPRPAGMVGGHRTRRPGDGSDLLDVRAYQPGDRLRRIDWRLTARRGIPYVRRTSVDADADVVLFLDSRFDVGTEAALWARPPGRDSAGRGVPGSSLDLAVRAATSIAAAQLGNGDRVALVDLASRASWLRSGSGRRQLTRLRMRLALARALPQSMGVVLEPRRLPAGAVVIVLSPYLDDVALEVALANARRGAQVLAIDVLPDPVLADLAVPCAAQALEGVLAEQAGRRAALARHGIPVMRWDPDLIGARLRRWARDRERARR